MAIALVKAGTVVFTSNSAAPAFGQATTAGNLLVANVWANVNSAATTTASGWVKAIELIGSGSSCQVWYKPNCGASETAPTFTLSLAAIGAVLSEFSGVATSSPLDKTGTVSGTTGTTLAIAATANDTNASNVAITTAVWRKSSGNTTATFAETWTPASGTPTAIGNNGSTSGLTWGKGVAYLLNGHGGGAVDQNSEAITLGTGTPSSSTGVIATFLPAGGVAFIADQPPRQFQAVNRSAYF